MISLRIGHPFTLDCAYVKPATGEKVDQDKEGEGCLKVTEHVLHCYGALNKDFLELVLDQVDR